MISKPQSIYAPFFVLVLLTGCGGGGNGGGSPENNSENCSTTLTSSGVEVDINGNVIPNPTPTSTSLCESSTEQDDALDTSRLTTRFDSTESYEVWGCVRADGTSLHYALPAREDFHRTVNQKLYGFEIDPAATDTIGSQQLFVWQAPRSPNADTITLWAQEKVDAHVQGIQSDWTNITFATAGTMSVNSSAQGLLQCNRTFGFVPLDASRFDIACKYRGPIYACP